MKKYNAVFACLLLVLFKNSAAASSSLEEYFYASGKIKVVITVAAIVLIGLFVYLQRLDSRLKKLEKNKIEK